MDIKKIITLGVIFLFICVAIAPSINFNIVKATNDNDLVEVTTEACGINGFGNTTVKITREQYQYLQIYLVDFRARLNKTTTMEEAVPIFKEAVVELNKYGLLPKGMIVEKTQKLITRGYQYQKAIKVFEKLYNKNQGISDGNFFCLVTGTTTNTQGLGPIFTFINIHVLISELLLISQDIYDSVWFWSWFFSFIRDFYFPLYLHGHLYFGFYAVHEHGGNVLAPSEGWILSYGILGKKNWSGTFYGQIKSFVGSTNWFFDYTIFYLGVLGFTGLKIKLSNYYFLLGSCLEANVNSTPP